MPFPVPEAPRAPYGVKQVPKAASHQKPTPARLYPPLGSPPARPLSFLCSRLFFFSSPNVPIPNSDRHPTAAGSPSQLGAAGVPQVWEPGDSVDWGPGKATVFDRV